jgi:hypothetical protein
MKRNLLLLFFVASVVAGSGCSIFDPFFIAVNVEGLSGRYPIDLRDPADLTYNEADTVLASDYLNPDFSGDIQEVSIYDITVQTEGDYPGSVSGQVMASYPFGPTAVIATYSGAWSVFNTPQSLLQALLGNNPNITPLPGAVGFLIDRIQAEDDIILSSTGSASQASSDTDLFVIVAVFGQVLAAP